MWRALSEVTGNPIALHTPLIIAYSAAYTTNRGTV
jgi:hypothetical protein